MTQDEQAKVRRVFVVHGRNLTARDGLFTFLRAIDIRPIEFSEAIAATGSAAPYIGQTLDVAFDQAQAVIVLLTPDDIAYLRPDLAGNGDEDEQKPQGQARPNVLFEAGLAFGRHPKRTIIIESGPMRPFSDVSGRHVIRATDTSTVRQEITTRLRTAGCAVNTAGQDWLTAGDLAPALAPGDGKPLGKRLPGTGASARVRLDARYHSRGSNTAGRLELINRGTEDVHDVNVELPDDLAGFQLMDTSLPMARLPAGKTHGLVCLHHGGIGHRPVSNFDMVITGRTADGQAVRETVFVSLSD